MHPKRQQTGGILLLVRGRALDCRNSWGEDFWKPMDATAPAQTSSSANDAAPVHTTTADDLVIQQTSSTRNDGAAMTTASKHDHDDDESINHAALTDQEDRAHVMARGAREAILRARERKKERLSSMRQPRMTAMPAADMDAGDWADFDDTAESVTDDTVLRIRHQPAADPFRRSYNDPAPPVPSRELPVEARDIISRSRDERFDSVPTVREGIELPRPAHAGNASLRATGEEATDDSATVLPDNPALSSYDRVLQQARRIQRLSTTRRPQRVIRQFSEGAAASTVTESRTHIVSDTHLEGEPTSTQEPPAVNHVTNEAPPPTGWRDEPLPDFEPSEEAFDAFDASLDRDSTESVAVPGHDWDESDNPFPEDDDAPWLAAESMTLRLSPQPRPRFRMPQLSFWRHGQHANDLRRVEQWSDPAYDEDEVVAHTAWAQDDLEAEVPHVEDDPDWADDAVPVETYAAEQSAPVPADVAPTNQGTVAWDESWADEDWADEVEDPVVTTPGEDFVTAEATVPHRPQPAPASFDMANLRARLFARQQEPMPSPARDVTRHFAHPHAPRIYTLSPDDDPDPDPGPGASFDEPARFGDDERSEPAAEPEFDVRDVVRRQGEMLDMRIQIAPNVPRECRTCRNFRPAEGGERGWCTNEWAFSHRRMVNADDLPCESSIGCWWLPNDETWLTEDDLAALTQPTPLVDRLLGRLRRPEDEDEEEPARARAR